MAMHSIRPFEENYLYYNVFTVQYKEFTFLEILDNYRKKTQLKILTFN